MSRVILNSVEIADSIMRFPLVSTFLEYDDLSFEILYQGILFDEKPTETFSTDFQEEVFI